MTHENGLIFGKDNLHEQIQSLCVEYDAEGFASLWMLQNIFRDIAPLNNLSVDYLKDIDNVKQNPVICFLRDKNIAFEIEKFKSRVGNGKCKKIIDEEYLSYYSGMDGPSAFVICLNPNGVHENCRLSDEDNLILKMAQHLRGKSNSIYLVQGKRHHKKYDAKDLKCLSTAVSHFYGETEKSKIIFRKMFFIEEDQALFRIGLCLLDSVTPYLMRIVNRYSDLLRRVDSFKLMTKCVVAEKCEEQTMNIKDISQKDSFTDEQVNRLNFPKLNCEQIAHIASSKISASKRKMIRQNQNKNIKRRKKNSDQTGAFSSQQDGQVATNARLSFTDQTSMYISNAVEQRFPRVESSVICRVKSLFNRVSKEIDTIRESILFHEFKTIALRHEKVKGFGCAENSLNVLLKADVKSHEGDVREYLAQYFDLKDDMINGQYKIRIQVRERKIQYFSNLQQGSKIKKNRIPTDENTNFGSAGMFLKDNQGSYYFTTCAHVIGKGAPAFRPDNNTKIGVSILAIDSGEDMSNPFLDISVVEIRPEIDLTCTFGLKAITGEFTHFQVFRGDILEVRNQQMYIWGASDSNMRSGKCIACEDVDKCISIRVDTDDFAKPGDSGSIICVGDQVRTCYAAFILVGKRLDSDAEEYAAFKVSDAIDMIRSKSIGIEPFLSPSLNFEITANPTFSDTHTTLKRKNKKLPKNESLKKPFCCGNK